MVSILYVRLPCNKIYPTGVTYLADYLHKHSDAEQRIVDLAAVEQSKRHKFLKREIDSFSPDVIAFSWRDVQIFSPDQANPSLENAFKFYFSQNLLEKMGAALQGVKSILMYRSRIEENLNYIQMVSDEYDKRIVVGGPAFNVFPEQLISRLKEGTLGVIGEGEDVLLKVAQGKSNDELLDERVIFKKGGRLVRGEKKRYVGIEKFEAIDFEYIAQIFPQFKEYKNGYVGLQTKRGCPHRCIYCLYPYIEGREIRCKQPSAIAEEVRQLSDNFGVKKIWFVDSQFIPDEKSIATNIETLDRIIKNKSEISWGGYIRIESITRELARKMIDSGIMQFELSISSGSQRIIDFLQIGFKLEDFFKACETIKSEGYSNQKIILNYSLNAPYETKETLRSSIATYKKISGIFGEANVKPFIFFLGIQPHTELESFAIEQGYLPRDYNPLALTPRSIRKMIYNPPPLNKTIARACLKAWKTQDRENVGKLVLAEIEKELQ